MNNQAPNGFRFSDSTDQRLASSLRGFGLPGVLAILIILGGSLIGTALGAVLVLIWVNISRTPWRDIGYARPRSWLNVITTGIVAGVILKFLMKVVVMPLLGAPPHNSAYQFLVGNPAAAAWMILVVLVNAGFAEETVYRGWMFERLGKLFGTGRSAKVGIVLLTAALFAAAHYLDQGLPGVEQAMITGSVFGGMFAVTENIFLPMVVHVAFDLTAVAIIYWNIESSVAHVLFK